MITLPDYFGPRYNHPQAGPSMYLAADELLSAVNRLLDKAREAGAYADEIDPDTGTQVSGSRNGTGDGGWRPQDAVTGKPLSKHKQGKAIDIFDPDDSLDDWLTDEILEEFGLYREAPEHTRGWAHLQSVAPGSGRRTFIP